MPAYIRAFFIGALEALAPGRLERRDDGFWRISYVPAALREVPEPLRRRCGLPAESYAAITFDKSDLDAHRSLTFLYRFRWTTVQRRQRRTVVRLER